MRRLAGVVAVAWLVVLGADGAYTAWLRILAMIRPSTTSFSSSAQAPFSGWMMAQSPLPILPVAKSTRWESAAP